jgi:hypothetical protein
VLRARCLHGCHGPVAIMAVIAPVPQVRRATTRATSKGRGLCTPTTERYSDERRPRFTSTEVMYGITGTGVTELPGVRRREGRRPLRDPSKWFQSNEGEQSGRR